MTAWLFAFLFTQVVEMPIYRRGLSVSWPAAFGATAITHPFVWFSYSFFHAKFGVHYWTYVAFAELFAWSVEGFYFLAITKKRSVFLWSFVANATSVVLGLLSRHFFGAP